MRINGHDLTVSTMMEPVTCELMILAIVCPTRVKRLYLPEVHIPPVCDQFSVHLCGLFCAPYLDDGPICSELPELPTEMTALDEARIPHLFCAWKHVVANLCLSIDAFGRRASIWYFGDEMELSSGHTSYWSLLSQERDWEGRNADTYKSRPLKGEP